MEMDFSDSPLLSIDAKEEDHSSNVRQEREEQSKIEDSEPNKISEPGNLLIHQRRLPGLQDHLTNLSNAKKDLKGKAAMELKDWKEKGRQAIKDLKQKVKEEVKQYELKEAARTHQREQRERHRTVFDQTNEDILQSKEVTGGWVLTPSQMKFLHEKPYLYNASAGSYLELFFLQKFWLWLARFIPTFVAPSCITVLGLLINVACCITVLYFAVDLKSDAPAWAFVLCAIGVFCYQTLDALDGKQSFKVQNSPIEEIYDHACDAVSTIFVTLSVGVAAGLGNYPYLLYLFFLISLTAFYCTHWSCHVTHTMVFGKIDVSEGQWILILAHTLTAIYGQRIWHTTLVSFLGLELTLARAIVLTAIFSLSRSIVDNMQMVAIGRKTPLEEVGIDIPRKKYVFGPLIPLALLVSLTNFCAVSLFSVSPAVFILTFGFCFSKLTMSLVMVNISKGDMDIVDSSLAVPILLAINSVFPLVSPYTSLLGGLIYAIMDALRFFTYASWDLRVALDCHIFSIKYPLGHPKNRAGDNGFYINGLNTEKVVAEWEKFKENNISSLYDYFHAD